MNPLPIAAQVLDLPLTQLRAERIKGGLTNESWCVYPIDTRNHATHTYHNAVVVRFSTANEQALQLNRYSEAQVLKLVEHAGIGAPVLWCAPAQRILVTRKLSAAWVEATSLQNLDLLHTLAQLLRRLHALEIHDAIQPRVQRTQLLHTLKDYWAHLEHAGSHLSADERERAIAIAQESDHIATRCLCHNDVHHLNLLGDASRLWLLDWEYAGIGDPWFDLASVCVYHHLDTTQRSALLHAYCDNAEEHKLLRLERMCWLFDYIKSLWFAVRGTA